MPYTNHMRSQTHEMRRPGVLRRSIEALEKELVELRELLNDEEAFIAEQHEKRRAEERRAALRAEILAEIQSGSVAS